MHHVNKVGMKRIKSGTFHNKNTIIRDCMESGNKCWSNVTYIMTLKINVKMASSKKKLLR